MNLVEEKRQIELVNSQDDNWTIQYLAMQSRGLAQLACEDGARDRLTERCIALARFCRSELLRRFDLVLFGGFVVMKPNMEVVVN